MRRLAAPYHIIDVYKRQEPSFVDGPNLLWLRKDWMDALGLEEPETMEDAIEIVRAFVEQDPGGNGAGNTIGLVLSLIHI